MKRTVSILLALVLVFSLSVTAFADTDVIAAVDAQGNDAAEIVSLTSFDDRDGLPEEDRAVFEAAVASVMGAFEAAIKSGAIKPDEGCVASLYDVLFVTIGEAEGLEAPYKIDITKPAGFLAMMVFNDGAWSVASVETPDDAVRFVDASSEPIALVIQSEPAPAPTEAPKPVDPSAENNDAPAITEAVDAEGEEADITIIPYRDRDELNGVYKDVFTLAYEDLYEGFDKILENDEKLKAAAGENNVAVSDAFFVDAADVSTLNYPLSVEIELAKFGAENPDAFVALIQYVDGVWQFVDSSVNDGVVSASINEIGPFAVVVVAAE